jgi:DNA-binding transcriptional ArsR family regulator
MSVSDRGAATGAAPLKADVHEALTLDRVVHEPARLAILAVLASAAEVDFAFLLMATGLSKGNLSKQTSKLDEAGYITIRKYYKGKIPATSYCITPIGKAAFATYWERIGALGQSIQQPN